MVELILRYIIFFIIARVYCQQLELSAFEYRRLVNLPLDLGKCPYRMVQFPEAPALLMCRFPKRKGEYVSRQKKMNFTRIQPVHNASQIIQQIGMCDDRSADYFGLLTKGDDCAANVIASKLSFSHKTATWMFMEYYRPQVDSLKPNRTIDDVQAEFTNYLNNSYYTQHISYGTQEALIVELHFKSSDEATRAYYSKYSPRRMSQKMETVGIPRKVKVVRFSTADNVIDVKTFRSSSSFIDAMRYVKHCEKMISRTINEIANGWRKDHLKYGFKAYEIGPIAMESSTITQAEKRSLWEGIAMLQVDAKRTYATHKRYRKFCKRQRDNYCLQTRQAIKALKEKVTQIHTQRRDWLKSSYDQQMSFMIRERNNVKHLKTRIIILAKELRKMMKKKS